MFAEQAIFTSMVRKGKSGYHVVARSPGVTESEASALAQWSPSHGGLLLDEANRTSVNFLPLHSGRFALARTREGPPEYSGRGGRQLYTHAMIIDAAKLKQAHYQPLALYRDALALGHLTFRREPDAKLKPVRLSDLYPSRASHAQAHAGIVREISMVVVEKIIAQVEVGQSVVIPYQGDRIALAELLLSRLSSDAVMKTSFATSLKPSSVRPFSIHLVAGS